MGIQRLFDRRTENSREFPVVGSLKTFYQKSIRNSLAFKHNASMHKALCTYWVRSSSIRIVLLYKKRQSITCLRVFYYINNRKNIRKDKKLYKFYLLWRSISIFLDVTPLAIYACIHRSHFSLLLLRGFDISNVRPRRTKFKVPSRRGTFDICFVPECLIWWILVENSGSLERLKCGSLLLVKR